MCSSQVLINTGDCGTTATEEVGAVYVAGQKEVDLNEITSISPMSKAMMEGWLEISNIQCLTAQNPSGFIQRELNNKIPATAQDLHMPNTAVYVAPLPQEVESAITAPARSQEMTTRSVGLHRCDLRREINEEEDQESSEYDSNQVFLEHLKIIKICRIPLEMRLSLPPPNVQ